MLYRSGLAARLGYYHQALALVDEALASDESVPLLMHRAFLLRSCEHWQDAAHAYGQVLARQAGHADALLGSAHALFYSGQKEAAMAQCRHGMALPVAGGLFSTLYSQIAGSSDRQDQLARFSALLADPRQGAMARITAAFALGNCLLDCGHHKEGFEQLRRANLVALRQMPPYDPDWETSHFRALQQNFHVPRGQHDTAPGSFRPVFIIGLFRSGTTLCQQVLCAHPQVKSAGESHAGGQALLREYSMAGSHGLYTLGTKGLPDIEVMPLTRIGQHYRDITLQRISQASPVIIDKQPQNFALAGHLLAMLPDALVIHVQRDPMDVGLALYRRLFTTQAHYSYSLEHISRYIVGAEALASFWAQQYPERVLRLSYEALVTDTGRVVRDMLDFCGLPFDKACLAPHLHAGPVATASSGQVTLPIHTDAIGRWQALASELAPLRQALQANGLCRDN